MSLISSLSLSILPKSFWFDLKLLDSLLFSIVSLNIILSERIGSVFTSLLYSVVILSPFPPIFVTFSVVFVVVFWPSLIIVEVVIVFVVVFVLEFSEIFLISFISSSVKFSPPYVIYFVFSNIFVFPGISFSVIII